MRPLALFRGRLGHRQAGFSGELLDRCDKVEIVRAHDKADRITMRAAAKAMKKGFVLDDIKGRCLFVMKWAQAGIFTPPPNQLHPAADQSGKGNPAAQLVEKPGWKSHPII